MSDLKHKLQAWVSAYAAFDEPVGLYTCTGCLKQFDNLDAAVAHADEEEAFQRTAEMQLEEEKKAPAPKPEAPKAESAEPPKVDPAFEAHKVRMAALVASGKLVAAPAPTGFVNVSSGLSLPPAIPLTLSGKTVAVQADAGLQAHKDAMERLKKRQQRQQQEEAALKGCSKCGYYGPGAIEFCDEHAPKGGLHCITCDFPFYVYTNPPRCFACLAAQPPKPADSTYKGGDATVPRYPAFDPRVGGATYTRCGSGYFGPN